MITKIILAIMFFSGSSARADSYDSNALTLSNRILGCGGLTSDIAKSGYKLIQADETSVIQNERAMPKISQGVTKVTLGRDYRPMQGYAEITVLEIKFTKSCFGSPAADGRCTEVIESCEQK